MKTWSSVSQHRDSLEMPSEIDKVNANSGWPNISEHDFTEIADKMSDSSHGISTEDLQKFQVVICLNVIPWIICNLNCRIMHCCCSALQQALSSLQLVLGHGSFTAISVK